MITSILIDDEIDALETLEWKLNTYCPQVEVLGKLTDPRQAISLISDVQPDCIFLDIRMPRLSGFDILQQLKRYKSKVIFVTAHEEFAMKAIRESVFDYILKPVDKQDLMHVIQKLEKSLLLKDYKEIDLNTGRRKGRISLCNNGTINFYDYQEIIFLKAEGSYTTVHLTENRKIMLSKTLKEVESMFNYASCFYRIHNSYFINLNHVKEYIKCQGGALYMSNGEHVSISRSKKEEFLEIML